MFSFCRHEIIENLIIFTSMGTPNYCILEISVRKAAYHVSLIKDIGCLIVKWVKLNGSKGQKKNFFELWCLVASRGLNSWVSVTSFQKRNIDKKGKSEKLDFWWCIPQKGTIIRLFGATQMSKPLEATRHHNKKSFVP